MRWILCRLGWHLWKPVELKDTGVSGSIVWRAARRCTRCRMLHWKPWRGCEFVPYTGFGLEERPDPRTVPDWATYNEDGYLVLGDGTAPGGFTAHLKPGTAKGLAECINARIANERRPLA